ncbi:MAG: hypothetical protein GY715_15915 [Planctomycetes bacterium]|nr:hypothetical protein [Planctomycetota bacterium]
MAPAVRGRAFTLTELLLAVGLLAVVLLLMGRIFAAAAAVTRAGEAVTQVTRETAAIERQLRSDFDRLAGDGILAIRCVAVPNDLAGAARLLDPARPADAMLRCDQLLYFTTGVQSAQTFRTGQRLDRKGEAAAARVYFGHAFQLGASGRPAEVSADGVHGWDALDPVAPWTGWCEAASVPLVRTRFTTAGGDGDVYQRGIVTPARIGSVEARRWLLVRQAILLADDETTRPGGNGKTVYLDQVPSARSIFLDDPRPEVGFAPQVRDGRVDAAATQLDDLRRILSWGPAGSRPRRVRHALVSDSLLHYPRAERRAPSTHRVDQALTTSVIGSACSAVTVDWTYAKPGDAASPQPWFGLPDAARGVAPRSAAGDLERLGRSGSIETYEAVFGIGDERWPTALRVTLTLHDDAMTLQRGREVQFVIDLRRRAGMS